LRLKKENTEKEKEKEGVAEKLSENKQQREDQKTSKY